MEVIPVVLVDHLIETDEGDLPTQDVLAAAARYCEGEFADAGLKARADPEVLVTDPVLRAAVSEGLTVRQAGPDRPLTFGGDGDVLLGDTGMSIASDGERELLGLARALLDPRWTGQTIGVLSYSERNMGRPLVRACWQTIALSIGGSVHLGGLRTLIVVARTPQLAYDIHCSAQSGARYVLQGSRLVPRSTEVRATDAARSVARSEASHAVIFLGAGFSYSSNLPMGDGLRDQTLRRRYGDDGRTEISALAIRLYRDALHDNLLTQREIDLGEEAFGARLTLEQVVRIESTQLEGVPQTLADFRTLHDAATPGAAVLRLVQALQGTRRLVLVAVNFDEILDDAAGASLKRFASDEEIREFPDYLTRYLIGEETAVPLLKLHGTISDPMSCIVNAEQTERGLPERKKQALEIVLGDGDGVRVPWVYIGASLRDTDVVPVLQQPIFASRSEEMWVAPLREPSIDAFAQSRLEEWRSCGRSDLDARFISTGADEFCALLAAQIELLEGS